MKISSKGKYGIQALVDLVMHSDYGIVTLKSISERQGISERYLEQVFSLLRKSGLIIGKKGSQGGYVLSKSPNEITIGDILISLEGDNFLVEITEQENEIETFLNNNLWCEINKKINNYLNSITLENVVYEYTKQKENIIYYI